MDTTPGPGRVLLRGLRWSPVLGGLTGSSVWLTVFVATVALPAALATPLAFAVGAAGGIVLGATSAVVVALVARRGAVTPWDGAVVAAIACAGLATVLVLGGLGSGTGAETRFWWWVGLSVLFAGGGAAGGWLVAQPRWVSARPSGAAAAGGTACPGWSRAPGR